LKALSSAKRLPLVKGGSPRVSQLQVTWCFLRARIAQTAPDACPFAVNQQTRKMKTGKKKPPEGGFRT
jgi:hypothetical protein